MKIGRHAGSGRFTSIKKAISHPGTHVVETIKPDGNDGNKGGGKKK